MSKSFFGRSYDLLIMDEILQDTLNERVQKMLAQLEELSYEVPTTDGLGYPLDPRKVEENRNSFIKQQKLSEAKQARKDQMRRGKR